MQFFPYYPQSFSTLPIPKMSKVGKRWSDEEKQKVLTLALEGKTPQEMEKELPDRTAASIQSVMTRAGINKTAKKKAKKKAKKDAQKELSKNVGTRSLYFIHSHVVINLLTAKNSW
jgi:transposase-like protein